MQLELTGATAVLERTPPTLSALLHGLPDAWTRATEGPGSWSAYDVVGHLIHGERTDWIARSRIILDQGPERRFAFVARVLARQYGEAVGPWRAYLPVLSR